MRYRKLFRLYSGKEKTAYCAIFKLVIMFHSAYGIATKLVSNWEQCKLYTKSWQVLSRKRMSMLTPLKMSSLTCKCAFYRPKLNAKRGGPMQLNFEGL